MPIVTPADLYRRLYAEVVEEITRSDDNITLKAIDAAIDEAKMYLAKFDLVALFGTDAPPMDNSSDTSVAATVTSTFLQSIVIDIAVWQLIKLGNPTVNYEAAKTDYEQARGKLKDIQSGKAQPPDWPYKDTTGETAAPGDAIYKSSNPKRNHFF